LRKLAVSGLPGGRQSATARFYNQTIEAAEQVLGIAGGNTQLMHSKTLAEDCRLLPTN
jgi:hypothetical protein